MDIHKLVKNIPKAELHLHIEGTLEPELMFLIAKRNSITLPYKSVSGVKEAYNFNNLQDFLDIYYEGAGVFRTEQDFYDLTIAYLEKAHSQGVIYAEIFFDPQTHLSNGLSFEIVINGIIKALKDGEKQFGISSNLIPCFLRHLGEDEAFEILKLALPYKDRIIAFGLDSSERGNPPSKFKHVFEQVRREGFRVTVHAGEEGPAEYVWEALDVLQANRIDHGNHALDDSLLIDELVKKQIPLTVCPCSNLKLKVVQNLHVHPLKIMLKKGLLVSINSDDPAYFGGYVEENYEIIAKALNLPEEDIVQLAKNSFQSSFLSSKKKQSFINKIQNFYESK